MSNQYREGESDARPWGTWEVLAAEASYVVKRIVVSPNKRISLQRHRFREEHWIVVDGSGLVIRDGEQIAISPGSYVHLPLSCVHRIQNNSDVDLVFIEVQRGSVLDENDIERIDDDYGRITTD